MSAIAEDIARIDSRLADITLSLGRATALLEDERRQRIELLNRLVRIESRLVRLMLHVGAPPAKEAA